MADEIILSPHGVEKLKLELEQLKTSGRRKVQDDLREARSHGDLRENAAYDEAKLNQARLEGRIKDLEYILEIARIVERPDDAHEVAALGSKITVMDRSLNEEWTFTLVSSFEADPLEDLISIVSPVGRAMVGREVGDVVSADTPSGTVEYEILKLE